VTTPSGDPPKNGGQGQRCEKGTPGEPGESFGECADNLRCVQACEGVTPNHSVCRPKSNLNMSCCHNDECLDGHCAGAQCQAKPFSSTHLGRCGY
jgi:hypothetical protein